MADFTTPNFSDLIDNLNTQLASATPKVDFSPIGNLPQDYYQGQKNSFEQQQRNLFKNGVPTKADGTPDYPAMVNTLIESGGAGGLSSAMPLLTLEMQKKMGQDNYNAIANPQSPPLPPSSSNQMPRGIRNNNPGNLTATPWTQGQSGYSGADGRFAQFNSPEAGTAAAGNLLINYGNRGIVTPLAIASTWAPKGDGNNNPAVYGGYIAKQLGVDVNTPLNLSDPTVRAKVVQAIAQFENGQRASAQPQGAPQPVAYAPQAGAPMPAPGMPQPPVGQPMTQGAPPMQPGAPQATPPPQMQPQQQQPAPQDMAARAYGQAQQLRARAAAIAGMNPQGAKVLSEQAAALESRYAPTPEMKNAQAAGLTNPLEFGAQQAGLNESYKQDATTFEKRYTGIQALGEAAYNGIQKAQLMKQLTLDPNFYSGPLHESMQTYNQFKSIFGANPSSALPQEAFNKVTTDMLTEQIKALGQSGVGRVLMAEVNNMKQSIASLGITPASNRALAEIVSRVYAQQNDIAGLAREIPHTPGKMNNVLDTHINDYLKSHPLFTKQELQHPALLGAPDAPPQSVQWSPEQKRAWAGRVGLKPGDPIRFNGQIVQVP